ncbi:MAG: hypothetical protein AB7K24_14190 [Gemmataceae bacterium]
MNQSITSIHIRQQLRDLSEPELWISVAASGQADGLELHGRLVGPRCVYATTVEVAYPLRPFPRLPEGLPLLSRRIVIPEASYWDPQSPFLYEGTVELWQGNERRDGVSVTVGLKITTLSQRGVRLNGHIVDVQGCLASPTLEDAGRLRAEGLNTLIVPVRPDNGDLWEFADRIGLLLLGQIEAGPLPIPLLQARMQHACCLGWIAPAARLDELTAARISGFRGVWLETKPEAALPASAEFVLASEGLLPALESIALPKLFLRPGNGHNGQARNSIGWVTG